MTRVRMLRAAAATLLAGVAAAACTSPPEPASGPTATVSPSPTTESPPSPTASPSASPLVLTQDDNGRRVNLGKGGIARLRLSNRWQWQTPSVDGTAIVLVPVAYESDPGFREWEVRAARPGHSAVRTTGRPGPQHVRITFNVTG